MQALQLVPQGIAGVAVTQSPDGLGLIHEPSCAGVIWNRQPLSDFQSWIDGLEPDQLPVTRVVLRPHAVQKAVSIACDAAKMPACKERTQLVDDIAALADIFAGVMSAPYLRLRLACVRTNACRKFHLDAITARLICTYRGTGTQYGVSYDGGDPKRVFAAPRFAPILLRGSTWPEQPTSGLLHRSPPIEGTGEARLVLVLDPVFDLEDEE
jgi:hypothetical protein